MPESKLTTASFYLVSALFLLAIFIPFLGSLFNLKENTELAENRALTPLPAKPNSIKTFKRYPGKFNLYYQDNFYFREQFLWYNKFRFMLGDSPSEKVTIGKNNWLFFNGEPFTELRNVTRGIKYLSRNELTQFAASLSARYQWLSRQGIDYLFIIAPNKHSIYPEFLPDYLFKVNATTITDQLVNYLQQNTQVPVLDLRKALIRNKSTDTRLYYRTDTHWNHYGANIAQYEIAKKLAQHYPADIPPRLYTKKDFQLNPVKGGDLAGLLGQKEKFDDLHPEPILHGCTRRPPPPNGNYSATFSTNCKQSKLNALIFRDSFFEYLYRFISLYFNQATFVSKRIDYITLKQLIENKQPDIVIEEWAERFLPAVPEVDSGFLSDN